MEELKRAAELFRNAADIIDEIIEADKNEVSKEVRQELEDKFLLQIMKIQRIAEGK